MNNEASSDERDWPYWASSPQILVAGGLIDPGYLDRFHRMSCGYARHYFRLALRAHSTDDFSDQFQNLSLMFVNSSRPNALAIEREGRRGIAVYLGILRRLWSLFQIALSSHEFLEGMISCELDGRLRVRGAPALDDSVNLLELADQWPEERAKVLYDLFARAVDFIVYHELAHHARRHLPFLRSSLGVDVIDEALSMHLTSSDASIFRFLEFDADHHALDMLITAADRERRFSLWTIEESETRCFQWTIAILSTFLLFDIDHIPIDDQYKTSHPAPVHRAMRMSAAISRTFAREFGWEEDRRVDWHDSAWWEVSVIAGLLGLPEGRWRGDRTDDMRWERFVEEERSFIAFSTELDALSDEDE